MGLRCEWIREFLYLFINCFVPVQGLESQCKSNQRPGGRNMYIEGGGEGVGNEIETKTDAYKTKLHFGKAMRIAQLLIGEGRKTGFHTAHQYDEPVYSQAFYTV